MPALPWKKWYGTARWKALRLATFLRDLYTCQMGGCGYVGFATDLVCDHKHPHRGSEALFWDPDNLQTLCKRCHDSVKQAAEQATLHQRGVWD